MQSNKLRSEADRFLEEQQEEYQEVTEQEGL